jgi:hypothetical protein
MNASMEGLSTENTELKKENQKMNTLVEKMNTLIEALTNRHEKDIAKLSEELPEEKRCRSEELEAIRQVLYVGILLPSTNLP